MNALTPTQIEKEVLGASPGREPQCFAPKEWNDTQRILHAGLIRLGPNGEHWGRGFFAETVPMAEDFLSNGMPLIQRCGTLYCARGVLQTQIVWASADREFETGWYIALDRAAHQLRPDLAGYDGCWVAKLNDEAKDFSEVRNMFLRAIELAGETSQA